MIQIPQDTLHMPINPVDSVVSAPTYDNVTPIIQWIFQQPPWVMWGGVVIGAVCALIVLWWAWPRRDAGLSWIRTRSTGVKATLVGGAAVAVLVALGVGYSGFHFMETDRRFCNGCHIFVPSGQAWVLPDTGSYTLVPRLEGKHDTINCHTCHTLKPLKEAVKMFFWMSGHREDKIPEHGKVPTTICSSCHVQGAAKETWQAIAATAGHRVHLESDSSAMQDKKECLTCHAKTAHRFQPPNETCGQSGCHKEDDIKIRLGKMSQIGDFHCGACHNFTVGVPALATTDSAAGAMTPNLDKCFSCHEMKKRLPDFDITKDPHSGTCGMCHNPHIQVKAGEAVKSCATAQCHADWREEPFHVGTAHKKVATDCLTCHMPHAAKVDASDCEGCHEAVKVNKRNGRRFNPPMPFDTTKALRQSAAPAPVHPDPVFHEVPTKVRGDGSPAPAPDPVRESKVKGDAPPLDDPGPAPPPPGAFHAGAPPGGNPAPPWRQVRALPPLPSDTFSHDQHKKQACLTCHVVASGRGPLTFQRPRGCQICHHQAPVESRCSQCHEPRELEVKAVPVTIEVRDKPSRTRDVGFKHDLHTSPDARLKCQDCHTGRVDLPASDSVKSCQGCHVQHHEVGRDCASCHRTAGIEDAHETPVATGQHSAEAAHTRCDACHDQSRIVNLTPSRTFCLACHSTEVDHYKAKECSVCHFQATPAEWKPRLIGGRAP